MRLITYFHPIISIQENNIIAVEALSRYRENSNDELRPIIELINKTDCRSDLLELDLKLIRNTAKSFCEFLKENSSIMLFLNVSSAVVNRGYSGVKIIAEIMEEYNISSEQVVLEILEENLENTYDCNNFFNSAREKGFSIALDDVGVGFSNLQRIAHVKPEIIKLDMSLISGLDQDYYKMKVFESLTRLAHDIGSLVVAEGVETLPETLKSLELGAGFLQGFFFCRPNPEPNNVIAQCNDRIKVCREEFKQLKLKQRSDFHRIQVEQMKSVDNLSIKLSGIPQAEFEIEMMSMIRKISGLQCLFILDENGVQITETITLEKVLSRNSFLFWPAEKGADHSLKPYYPDSETLTDCQVTDTYISHATGMPCRTYSKHFHNNDALFTLCIDYSEDL